MDRQSIALHAYQMQLKWALIELGEQHGVVAPLVSHETYVRDRLIHEATFLSSLGDRRGPRAARAGRP